MRMEYYFRYREINDEDGSFYETDVEFPTLMKKHIQKHGTALQPIYEAISNSFEATKDENYDGDRYVDDRHYAENDVWKT